MTNRLVAWIGKQAIKRTFASIADEVGVVEGTVRLIFKDYVSELEQAVRFKTPKWMGIDEIHLIKPRGVIANIQNNTIVELLHNRQGLGFNPPDIGVESQHCGWPNRSGGNGVSIRLTSASSHNFGWDGTWTGGRVSIRLTSASSHNDAVPVLYRRPRSFNPPDIGVESQQHPRALLGSGRPFQSA